ncbi:hypothetical protein BpHYR1_008384 [Brachionus plicatilis]|uniref:Uncharacterized protein n=1 Tax=Brachionus plicatilis TaxID=10195 RepID=A0A3M7QAI1_BRAPC|nr:hypothetical protein BpHYR1_008384 [Brachionus plicatilis]
MATLSLMDLSFLNDWTMNQQPSLPVDCIFFHVYRELFINCQVKNLYNCPILNYGVRLNKLCDFELVFFDPKKQTFKFFVLSIRIIFYSLDLSHTF